MELVGAIIDLIKCLGPPTCRYIDHHRKLEERMNDLRARADELNTLKRDTERRINVEHRRGNCIREEVQKWLQELNKIDSEIQIIDQRVQNVSCFSRARLGKCVAQTIYKVEGFIEQHSRFTEPMVIDDLSVSGVALPVDDFEGEIDVKEEIWNYLTVNEIGMIGVWGMGGIGKTTIMKHIHNQLLKETMFDKVIWVTVSKEPDIPKLRQDIANALNIVNFPESEQERVAVLLDKLEQIRFVLILDDVWNELNLVEVGIPRPTLVCGSKLVLISRSSEVCNLMGCKIVQVKPLSNEESMNLFLKHVGDGVLQKSSLREILGHIVQECDGLPLAIVVIARSMKGIDDVREWNNALRDLHDHVRSVKGTNVKIYEKLKFSYDRLGDLELQNCFLYCSLYPEDYIISRVELIEYWIDEGFLGTGRRLELYDRGHTILNKLENNCLLEKGDHGSNVKMHDVMRDTALYIKRSRPCFMVKAGTGLKQVPSKQEWEDDLERVSLMMNSILEIPSDLSPNCEDLSTLLLQENRDLRWISESFFSHMPRLCILDLSFTNIKQLPNSMSNLEKLHAFVLHGCKSLRYVPSVKKLKELRKLDLCDTGIEKVPHGLEMLTHLTYLNLSTKWLQKPPITILPKLSSLQYLVLYLESRVVKVQGLELAARLSKLETFEGRFNELTDFNKYSKSMKGQRLTSYKLVMAPLEAKFDIRPVEGQRSRTIIRCANCSKCRTKLFKVLASCEGVKSVSLKGKDKDQLEIIGQLVDFDEIVEKLGKLVNVEIRSVRSSFPFSKKDVILSGCQIPREDLVVLPTDLRCLRIFQCHNVRCLSDVSSFFQQTNELRSCLIHDCREMESLLDLSSSSSSVTSLLNLEHLRLERLDNLHMLVKAGEASVGSISSSTPMPGIFSHLKAFGIKGCSTMKQLFPFELVHELQNLKELIVDNCGQMEEIIASKEEEENCKGKGTYSDTVFALPKLRDLILKKLPELKSICSSNGVLTCDSLEDIQVLKCPKLKRMPLNLPLFHDSGQSLPCPLKSIGIDSEEW